MHGDKAQVVAKVFHLAQAVVLGACRRYLHPRPESASGEPPAVRPLDQPMDRMRRFLHEQSSKLDPYAGTAELRLVVPKQQSRHKAGFVVCDA